jgi:predicted DNA-binding transcriptional regulator AlpA
MARRLMSDPDPTALLGDILIRAIREAVREEIRSALSQTDEEDRLLDAEEAARILGVSEDWIYRNAKKLPFARKVGPKMLRFSFLGIQKYLAARNTA